MSINPKLALPTMTHLNTCETRPSRPRHGGGRLPTALLCETRGRRATDARARRTAPPGGVAKRAQAIRMPCGSRASARAGHNCRARRTSHVLGEAPMLALQEKSVTGAVAMGVAAGASWPRASQRGSGGAGQHSRQRGRAGPSRARPRWGSERARRGSGDDQGDGVLCRPDNRSPGASSPPARGCGRGSSATPSEGIRSGDRALWDASPALLRRRLRPCLACRGKRRPGGSDRDFVALRVPKLDAVRDFFTGGICSSARARRKSCATSSPPLMRPG